MIDQVKPDPVTDTREGLEFAPTHLKLWICCHCLSPRLYGSRTDCHICGALLHETADYGRKDCFSRATQWQPIETAPKTPDKRTASSEIAKTDSVGETLDQLTRLTALLEGPPSLERAMALADFWRGDEDEGESVIGDLVLLGNEVTRLRKLLTDTRDAR